MNFTVSKQSDRQAIAKALVELAKKYGATAEIDPEYNQEIVVVIIAQRGLSVRVSLDGNATSPDTHLLTWYFTGHPEEQMADLFAFNSFGQSVDPNHRRKATYVAEGTAELIESVKTGLQMAQDGRAFENSLVEG